MTKRDSVLLDGKLTGGLMLVNNFAFREALHKATLDLAKELMPYINTGCKVTYVPTEDTTVIKFEVELPAWMPEKQQSAEE